MSEPSLYWSPVCSRTVYVRSPLSAVVVSSARTTVGLTKYSPLLVQAIRGYSCSRLRTSMSAVLLPHSSEKKLPFIMVVCPTTSTSGSLGSASAAYAPAKPVIRIRVVARTAMNFFILSPLSAYRDSRVPARMRRHPLAVYSRQSATLLFTTPRSKIGTGTGGGTGAARTL